MPKQPIFSPRGAPNPGQLIVHPNAPVLELKITIDNRYEPPLMYWTTSQQMPAVIALSALLQAAQMLTTLQIQAEMEKDKQQQKADGNEPPPNLPDAPPKTN